MTRDDILIMLMFFMLAQNLSIMFLMRWNFKRMLGEIEEVVCDSVDEIVKLVREGPER